MRFFLLRLVRLPMAGALHTAHRTRACTSWLVELFVVAVVDDVVVCIRSFSMCRFRVNECDYRFQSVLLYSRCVSVSKCTHNALNKVRCWRNPSLLFFFFFFFSFFLSLSSYAYKFFLFSFSTDAFQNIDSALFLLHRTYDIEDEFNKFEEKKIHSVLKLWFFLSIIASKIDVIGALDRMIFTSKHQNRFDWKSPTYPLQS